MNDEATLLPCPFCGGEASKRLFYKGKYRVHCNDCDACSGDTYGTEAEAIAAWNTRPAKTIGKAQVEIEPDVTELTQTYDAGFRDGIMAVFQQLEGIEDYKELQRFISEYWREGEGYGLFGSKRLSERYVELPVDADGVPIHVGDTLQLGDTRSEVMALDYRPNSDELPWGWLTCDGEWLKTAYTHHVKPRTVEDVLREFAANAVYCNHADEDAIAKYTAELRMRDEDEERN